MTGFDELGIQLTDLLAPWIAILISISAAFWFKDFATNLMIGLKYRTNSHFNEGDHVILDGKDAIIVKFGTRETVFGIYTDRGYVWRFIPNDKLPNQKLEKIINKNLHLDTEEEKGRRIQEMIDKAQDEKITANKEAINNLKK
tara:strand:- start:5467 stop:5895 length:429 start_codon:yes stop_codon:yes gene_type:complete